MKMIYLPIRVRETISKTILFVFDIFVIVLSLYLGYLFTETGNDLCSLWHYVPLLLGTAFYPLYIIVVFMFFYEGIYTYRYDFWHESKIVMKSLFLSFITVLAYSALTMNHEKYSPLFVITSFLCMAIIIPLTKLVLKKQLFKLGLWKRKVAILNGSGRLASEIFDNAYLGYVQSDKQNAQTVFVDSDKKNATELKELIEVEIQKRNRVLFVPILNTYQFKQSDLYELTNSRLNLIVLHDRLKSKRRMLVNITYNYILAVLLLPLLLPIVGLISLWIKFDSKGAVFFKQQRLGKDGEVFLVYKFRTMHEDSKQLLDAYLEQNPDEVENYAVYHKYKNDPRITKVGHILRATSLDELAQIFNVLKGEMSFAGPRPYMLEEKVKIGRSNEDIILRVKPGITGLWQVSGRSELTFEERVDLDKWYIQNWSLWMDFVIFMKTISVVLGKVGAR